MNQRELFMVLFGSMLGVGFTITILAISGFIHNEIEPTKAVIFGIDRDDYPNYGSIHGSPYRCDVWIKIPRDDEQALVTIPLGYFEECADNIGKSIQVRKNGVFSKGYKTIKVIG